MTKHDLTLLAQGLKKEMLAIRTDAKGSINDLKILVKCYKQGEYTEMFKTKLYKDHGGEYCQYLQLLH